MEKSRQNFNSPDRALLTRANSRSWPTWSRTGLTLKSRPEHAGTQLGQVVCQPDLQQAGGEQSGRGQARALELGLLRTPPAQVRNNLPRSLTSFIGRETEIAQVLGLVRANPLVTVTGSGGAGKTRLALKTAEKPGALPGRGLAGGTGPIGRPRAGPAGGGECPGHGGDTRPGTGRGAGRFPVPKRP